MASDFYRDRKVLVTGGAGFVGSHLVEMLVGRGAKVTVPVRSTTRLDFLLGVRDRISIVQADLNNRAEVDAAMAGQEIVLNLAAAKGGGIANSILHQASLFRDNMSAFLNVLDSARVAHVDRFLVVSSACVYPRDTTSPTPETEGFKDVPEAANAGYGWSKRMEEYLGKAYAEEFSMRIAIARPYNAFGPRDDFFAEYNHVIPGLTKRIVSGENPLVVWGSGRQTRSFIYVTDFARGLLEVCEKCPTTDVLNIGSSEEISVANLATLLVELTGTKTEIIFDTTKPEGQSRRTCDTSKAAQTIGFRAEVALRDGLAETIRWYLAERQSRGMTSPTP